MEIDPESLESLRALRPRDAYETVRRSVQRNPWGVSSEDLHAALKQLVDAGILSWEMIERFEDS